MFETLRKPGSFIVTSATLIGGVYVARGYMQESEQAGGGEAEDGGGEESEGEVSFLYLFIMFVLLVFGVPNLVRLFIVA